MNVEPADVNKAAEVCDATVLIEIQMLVTKNLLTNFHRQEYNES